MLLGTRYISQSGWPETLLGQSYLVFNWIGHFGFLIFALYILIIFPASFIIPSQRLMRLFAVIVATVGMMVLLLDIYAYQTLHLHLNPLVWELLLSGEKNRHECPLAVSVYCWASDLYPRVDYGRVGVA